MTARAYTVDKRGRKRLASSGAKPRKRVAWLVVDALGDLVVACPSLAEARDDRGGWEGFSIVRVEYEWPQRAKKGGGR